MWNTDRAWHEGLVPHTRQHRRSGTARSSRITPHFLPIGAFMAGHPASALSGDVGCPSFEQQIRGDRGFRYEVRMPEIGKAYNRSTVDLVIFCPVESGSPERQADGLHEFSPGSLGVPGTFSLNPSLPKRLRYFVHRDMPLVALTYRDVLMSREAGCREGP